MQHGGAMNRCMNRSAEHTAFQLIAYRESAQSQGGNNPQTDLLQPRRRNSEPPAPGRPRRCCRRRRSREGSGPAGGGRAGSACPRKPGREPSVRTSVNTQR